MAVENPAASNAALSGTAVSRSSMVIRMRAAMGSKLMPSRGHRLEIALTPGR